MDVFRYDRRKKWINCSINILSFEWKICKFENIPVFKHYKIIIKYWSWWARKRETTMIWKKLKITVEQSFQRDWLENGKWQILDKPQSDFPLKIANYITKRAEFSLQIRIVKSTLFMIPAKNQAILVTQKQCQFILGEPLIRKNCCTFLLIWDSQRCSRLYKKCDRFQRQSNLPPNIKNEIHSVPASLHVKKQVGLDLVALLEVDNCRHLIVCNDYLIKWLEASPIRERTALMVATFLYELMCRNGCFKVQINDQRREFVSETSLIFYAF